MFRTLFNVFRIGELRNKLLFTLALLCVYRIGFYVPIPGVNTGKFISNDGALGVIAQYLSLFSGGSLSQSSIFGLGIMPYISASIILQLLSTVVPSLEKLKKEGEPGMRKINEWTRYLTVGICIVQGTWWISTLLKIDHGTSVYPLVHQHFAFLFVVMGVTVLTAGSLFLMWLGEQIDQYGIGNGVSLIITAGIVSRMPVAMESLWNGSPFADLWANCWTMGVGKAIQKVFDVQSSANYSVLVIVFLVLAFVFVVAGSILLTQAQRRIRIQQAKHVRGRRVYGGQQQYLPLRVNHAGVMPIIFASSLMMIPNWGSTWIAQTYGSAKDFPNFSPVALFLGKNFNNGSYLYELLYVGMIFFFSYFWNTVQFNPKEIATQLRDHGSFIPGLRPGKRTADYLENVMTRITYVGAAFLCVIAVVPNVVATYMLKTGNEAFLISQFLGGTGLLIVISVMLDLVNRIEANLVMRNYQGFLESSSAANRLKNRIRPGRGGPGGGDTDRSSMADGPTRGLPA